MKHGYLFASKGGALSFADEVSGVFENARNAVGFVQIKELKPGQRTSVAAFFNMYFVSYLLKYVSYLFEGA